MSEPRHERVAGKGTMPEVYGLTVDPASFPGRSTDITVDHLIGTRAETAADASDG